MVSRSRIIAPGYGNLAPGGPELEVVKSLRILGVTIDSKLMFETESCGKLGQRQPGVWGPRAEQECYLNVGVCSRAVSMNMFCPA